MKHAAIVYYSKTGNTEKVALAMKEGLEKAGVKVSIGKTEEMEDIDFFKRALSIPLVGTTGIQRPF